MYNRFAPGESALSDPEEAIAFQGACATVGIERWGQRSGALAPLLRKHPDAVSRWVREGAQRRSRDSEFSDAMDDLDERLSREAIDRVKRGFRNRA